MEKQTLVYTLAGLLGLVVIYMIAAVTAWDLNPANWYGLARFCAVATSLGWVLLVLDHVYRQEAE